MNKAEIFEIAAKSQKNFKLGVHLNGTCLDINIGVARVLDILVDKNTKEAVELRGLWRNMHKPKKSVEAYWLTSYEEEQPGLRYQLLSEMAYNLRQYGY